MAIYWQRYGWVAPDMEISGLEDEYVLSAGMPRLVYVKRPAPDMEPRLAEMLARLQDEDIDLVQALRRRGRADTSCSCDDLAILLTERFDAAARQSTGTRPAFRTATCRVPVSAFIGREAVLRDLGALLDSDGARLVTLAGPGGTGKTRLAVEIAAERASRYPDGVFFVDLSAERERGRRVRRRSLAP